MGYWLAINYVTIMNTNPNKRIIYAGIILYNIHINESWLVIILTYFLDMNSSTSPIMRIQMGLISECKILLNVIRHSSCIIQWLQIYWDLIDGKLTYEKDVYKNFTTWIYLYVA